MFKRHRIKISGILFVIVVLLIAAFSFSTDLATQAYSNRCFSFPRDHGNHPEFQTEWWYFSGNLESKTGKEWGYQCTIFRHRPALPLLGKVGFQAPCNGYAGHLVITNMDDATFQLIEDWGSPLFGYAGAKDRGRLAWLGNWRLEEDNGLMRLVAGQEGFGVEFDLAPAKPPVLNGANGLSYKDSDFRGSSYHYSITSLKTKGVLKWGGEVFEVHGKSWLDREFGSSIFPPSIRGWDWFSLRLDDDSEIMVTLLRSINAGPYEMSYGTMVLPNGVSRGIRSDEFRVEPLDFWNSPETGARYPMGWRISLAKEDAELVVKPYIKTHELCTRPYWRIDYWEGPVRVSGRIGGKEVTGKGYAELTGYVQNMGGKF